MRASRGIPGFTLPIRGHFLGLSGAIYLVVCIPTFRFPLWAVGGADRHLGFLVNPRGRRHKGKRSQGQGYPEHGGTFRASRGILGFTSPIRGHFVGFSGGIYLVGCNPSLLVRALGCRGGVEGVLGLFVNPKGRRHKGERSLGQGYHEHGGASRTSWGIPGPTRPIPGHFGRNFRAIYLVDWISAFVRMLWVAGQGVRCPVLFVSPRGRRHKGKRSQAQGCHEHGGALRARWGMVGRTRPILGHFMVSIPTPHEHLIPTLF